VGAGWFELKHRAYGIPFPAVVERLRRLEETLEIIRRLWTEERTNFAGQYHSVEDAVFNPKPVQKLYPAILVGAAGEKLALTIVAQHAQMWNSFGTPEVFLQKIAILDEHCRQIGRDPTAIEKSVLLAGVLPLAEAPRRIEEYMAVGVTHLIFSVNPSTDRPQIRQFARDIMPAFRQSRT
jgi:alkanesulfonate monooxygenase SsuD/methylene tetrahydromethanopterin reductase-like flavin-dependent oxidoreductase (luciferase family)